VAALGDAPEDAALHACRILAKRARYAAEAVAPAAGPDAERFAKAVAKLQTVLGEHQDSATAREWLRAHAGSGRRAFVAGEMAALELELAERSRAKWRGAWRRLDQGRLRAWMKPG
jgi:CHAD domain-containing protein